MNKEATELIRELKQAGVPVKNSTDGWVVGEVPGKKVVIHRTPSSRRWKDNAMADLKRYGIVNGDFGKENPQQVRKTRAMARRQERAILFVPKLDEMIAHYGGMTKLAKELVRYSNKHQRVVKAQSRRPDMGSNASSAENRYVAKVRRWHAKSGFPNSEFLKLTEDFYQDTMVPVRQPDPPHVVSPEIVAEVLEQMTPDPVVSFVEVPEQEPLIEWLPMTSKMPELALATALCLDKEIDYGLKLDLVKKIAAVEMGVSDGR